MTVPSDALLLALDSGTQSVRALLFDARGNLVAKSQVVFQPTYLSSAPGRAEQDPELYWRSLCEACRALFAQPEVQGVRRDAIAGVAVTTQRATVVNLDAHGNPLRNAIVWLDQRRTPGLPPLGGLWGLLFRVLGIRETVAYFQAEAEANWLSVNEPEILAKTHKFVLLSGFLNHRLTGRFADSAGSQVGYLPFDYKTQGWAPKRDWKWSAVALTRSQMPDLVPPAGLLGEITRAAADATGIPAGLPVFAAAADKACEVLGSGALDPSVGCLSYGTTATINTTHPKYIEVVPLVPPYHMPPIRKIQWR